MLLPGCDDLLDVGNPRDKVLDADVFQNPDSAIAAISGIYGAASRTINLLSGSTTIYSAIYSDELTYTETSSNPLEFFNTNISPFSNTIETNFWRDAYMMIYHINSCIDGLDKTSSLPKQLKNQLTGESRFMRALIYFNMIQLFGEVPLALKKDYRENELLGRTDIATIKDAIREDLLLAKTLLSEKYPTEKQERVRPNKWAAVILLARFYLYTEQWQQAVNETSEVLTSGPYSLESPQNVFKATSREAIFQIRPELPGYNTMEANILVPPTSVRPAYALSAGLKAAFEPGDKRWSTWVGQSSSGLSYVYKYKVRANFSGGLPLTEYNTVLRLGEAYLIRAEARANLRLLHSAIEDLDSIRNRAGLPLISVTDPGISAPLLLEKIYKERRIELFAEWGHRWFDLKRTGKVQEVMKAVKPNWDETDILWPIPVSQIILNPLLTQNSGY
ncbi:RagB/SusD family nutrient uptake outer membrane protein [Chitinophaga sp. S165]|uniref:RagB/SusD family nutrient uptake outer membrane protein n=1 Tax=Chitinophaga sp. S165 TaxID=2135462 RepID=UPI001304D7F0|nr:RagB/SusD family nutrient uptake outer membrane protein [Chitinophaga sp. S165]